MGETLLLDEVTNLVSETKEESQGSIEDIMLFNSSLSRDEVVRRSNNLIFEWKNLQTEIAALSYASEVLLEETENQKTKLSKEIECIWNEYEERYFLTKKMIDKTIKSLAKHEENEMRRIAKQNQRFQL